MSTILEALKKSERERKLNDIPTLSDMPSIEEPSPFKWVLLTVGSLLLVSILAAFIVKVMMPSQSASVGPVPVAMSPEESVARATLSVLSFSDNPAQRFAIINDKLVREGDFLATGMKVDEILADRVIMIINGDRLSLTP